MAPNIASLGSLMGENQPLWSAILLPVLESLMAANIASLGSLMGQKPHYGVQHYCLESPMTTDNVSYSYLK